MQIDWWKWPDVLQYYYIVWSTLLICIHQNSKLVQSTTIRRGVHVHSKAWISKKALLNFLNTSTYISRIVKQILYYYTCNIGFVAAVVEDSLMLGEPLSFCWITYWTKKSNKTSLQFNFATFQLKFTMQYFNNFQNIYKGKSCAITQ